MPNVQKAIAAAMLLALPLQTVLPAAHEEPRRVPDLRPSPPAPTMPAKPSAEAVSRGRMLYENHCMGCHASVAHIRDNRRAESFHALEAWVIRWADQQQLGWGPGEVVEVVDYLNRRYYKFPSSGKK